MKNNKNVTYVDDKVLKEVETHVQEKYKDIFTRLARRDKNGKSNRAANNNNPR